MIKIPTGSREQLLNIEKIERRASVFTTSIDFKAYFGNVGTEEITFGKVKTIIYNLESNAIFKYSDNLIREKIFKILKKNTSEFKELTKGDIYKLYLYFYDIAKNENELQEILNKYAIDPIEIGVDNFMNFLIGESNHLYSKWKFPIEIEGEYKLFEKVVHSIKNKEILKKVSPIILTLGRYIDLRKISSDMGGLIAKELKNSLPSQVRSFFNRNRSITINKIEKVSNNIFIHLVKDVVVVSMDQDTMIGIDIVVSREYRRILEQESIKYRVYGLFDNFGKKMKELDYKVNIFEADKTKTMYAIIGVAVLLGIFFLV